MSKKLVAYFSATGVTAGVARKLAAAIGADLYEIKPETPYTAADLNWMDRHSRSTLEMKDASSRPRIADHNAAIENYDVVYLGFPIWWFRAPAIINTFLESYDFTGKTVALFATSGGSGFGRTGEKLQSSCPGAILKGGKMLNSGMSQQALAQWAENL